MLTQVKSVLSVSFFVFQLLLVFANVKLKNKIKNKTEFEY